MKKNCIVFSLIVIVMLGCTQNKYEVAKGLYNKKKYALAVDFL